MEMDHNSRELHAIEYIAALDRRLADSKKPLEKRLRSVPDLWRQYRIAETAVSKTLDGLYSTMTLSGLDHMLRVCEKSEVILRPKSVLNASLDSQVIRTKDLVILIQAALNSHCSMCMNTGFEIKQCELRKALMNVAPLVEVDPNTSLCGYAKAVNGKIKIECL